VRSVVEDSSGNAGAAIAAYAAALGIHAEIFVKQDAAPGKIRQIRAYGAKVTPVLGSREDVAAAAHAAAAESYYASHVYNPLFIAGVAGAAAEIHAEIGTPDTLYLPVGNGSLLLGLAAGFRALGALPRFVAVQGAATAPVFAAFHAGSAQDAGGAAGQTIADGVAVAAPARLEEMVAVIRESAGTVLVASNEQIRTAQKALGATGVYAEPTGALAMAGYLQETEGTGIRDRGPAVGSDQRDESREEPTAPGTSVVYVTGTGLKETT
jgi:threonine synthase